MDDFNKQNPDLSKNTDSQPVQNDGNVNGEYHFVPPRQNDKRVNNQNYYSPNSGSSYQSSANNQNSTNNTKPYGSSYYQPNNATFVNANQVTAKKPKNKALITIIIVVAVCAAIAVGAILFAAFNSSSLSSNDENSTSLSDDASAKVNDSEEAAKKDSNGNLTVAGVAEKSMDSCVLISVYTDQSAYSYFYSYGSGNNFNGNGSTLSGEGSGVIMSEANGKTYIMTCAHVIANGSTFKVTANDGTEYDASMVGIDNQTDIGVLSIDITGLQVAEFANSDGIEVGEQCVAIGCPGGSKFMNSVATGIVSALDRPVSSSIGYNNECIQTDTAINPGNSGGALFNMQGQVIGINSSKIASTDYEGMGFAVPSNTAVNTANSLIKNGYVSGRAKLGITYAPITNASNASAILAALNEKGFKDAQGAMIVDEISSDSDLFDKDIRQYDMIVAVNGETLTSTDVMTSFLSNSTPGDSVKLTIARIENNQIKTFEIECKLIESKE